MELVLSGRLAKLIAILDALPKSLSGLAGWRIAWICYFENYIILKIISFDSNNVHNRLKPLGPFPENTLLCTPINQPVSG